MLLKYLSFQLFHFSQLYMSAVAENVHAFYYVSSTRKYEYMQQNVLQKKLCVNQPEPALTEQTIGCFRF